jgi:starvation-inducible DNA-binding protein
MHSTNPELAAKLAKLLSDVVTAKFIFQGYHWNVLGPDFGEMHKFFGDLYEDVDGSIDDLAENILKVGFPAPYLLTDFVEMSDIKEPRYDGTNTPELLNSALGVNQSVLDCYNNAFAEAEKCNEQGLMDFLAGRIDMHKKWNWQIKAFLGIR